MTIITTVGPRKFNPVAGLNDYKPTVTATSTSEVIPGSEMKTVALQANIGAGLTGSIKVQVSVDGVSWADYASSSVNFTGNAQVQVWGIADNAAPYIQLVATVSGGSGTLEYWFAGRGA